MNMVILSGLLLSFMLSVQSFASSIGGVDGGGGPGIICTNNVVTSGRIAASLDLYEGGKRFGLTIDHEGIGPVAIQVQNALLKLKNHGEQEIYDNAMINIKWIFDHQRILPSDVGMAINTDVGTAYAPLIPAFGCELASVAYWEADGTVMFSKYIMDKMSNTNAAAVFVHEALYKMTREYYNAKDSAETRKLVAYLFSTSDLSAVSNILNHFKKTQK